MTLDEYTNEELQEELKRREYLPEPINSEDINIIPLRHEAIEVIQSIYKDNRPPKDYKQWLFETVMITFYGENIFRWINEHNSKEM